MSLVIACLQKATMPSFTFRRRQCLQSLHAFKRRQCLHLHFEDDNVFNHCMPSKRNNDLIFISKTTMSSIIACLQKATMPSFTFRRRQCLQSLYAFKGNNDHHLHFEDDNVFSHCMPSKATVTIICISKTTMSSVIGCLQKATMPSFTLLKMTTSLSQKLQYLVSLCFIGLNVLCFYAF